MKRAYTTFIKQIQQIDWLAPLFIRLYLVPVFAMAGIQKAQHFASTVTWFGNTDWGLGMPFPALWVTLAIAAELGGAICLALGFATRLASIPLMVTMMVAAATVHLKHGWLAIAGSTGFFTTERTLAAQERLTKIKSIVKEHGNYDWLTEHGNIVILNNGVEFAATYFILCFALLILGGGRYISLDFYLKKLMHSKRAI